MADEDVQMTPVSAPAPSGTATAEGTTTPTTITPVVTNSAGITTPVTTRSSRRNADRRTPRFSWNTTYEDTFFRSLCTSMRMGYKENHNFKSGAWELAAVALRDKHGACPEKSHLINKADNARKKFRMWRSLREDPDFLYNPNNHMVTASETAWNRHFEKEPLSKALRGRPFEHEEYMEILFPDVIGSGGAPKRVMKSKRKNTDGSVPPRSSDIDTSTLSPFQDRPPSSQNSTQQMQPPPTPSAPPPLHIPASTTVPPMSVAAAADTDLNTMALTPPDEGTPSLQSRKRPHPDSTPGGSERRRGRPSRFSASFYAQPAISTTTSSSSLSTTLPPSTQPSSSVAAASTSLIESGILSLAEALKARNPPRWPEQAVEILFQEFVDEDLDLQLKIAEKALTDDNKAMVFVKMTPLLRRHWVSRLREVHMRNLGGGLGLGRVGEDAS